MKRLVPVVAALAVVLLVGGAVALALTNDGPTAFSVRGRSVPQSSVDAELRALAENEALSAAVVQSGSTPLSLYPGSVTSDVGAGWMGLLISQEVVAAEVDDRSLTVTADDRARGGQLASESVGGQAIYDALPDWFQDRLADRWAKVAVLEGRLIEHPTAELVDGVASQCPSGRYVSHVLVATETEATAVESALAAGADFADVARTTSTDTGSAAAGGELGCVDGQSFVEPFGAVAASQPVGVVSDPVQTEFGFHVVLVTDQPSSADFERLALEVVLGASRGVAVDLDPRYGIWVRSSGQVAPQPVRGVATVPGPAPG